MSQDNFQLAIIDWGIGGIGIYAQVKARLGNIPITYFSDTGVTPYGKMSRAELISRLNLVAAFMRARGVTHLVIGCNAASTVLPFLNVADMKVEGVIESAIQVTERMRPQNLGLIGGRRTVLSGVYRRAFAARGLLVRQRIAQPLSARIESGDTSSQALRADCQTILSPLTDCSHVLLACTHYPAIISVLRESVSPEAVLIDPAPELVNRIKRWKIPSGGRDTFLTSGEPDKMRRAASNAFGIEIKTIKRVTI
jgi:glutamate racemase